MNIAFVNSTFGWGGVKTWYLQFAERLAKRGNHVFVYGRQPEFIDAARKRVGHGEQVSFGADLNPSAIRFFYNAFKKHDIDVIITNIGKDIATAGVAARLLNIPVVQRIGLPEDIPYRLKTRLLHTWIRPAFLCPCRFIAEGFIKSLPYIKAEDVHVVLNGKKASSIPLELHHPRRLVCTQQLESVRDMLCCYEHYPEFRTLSNYTYGEKAEKKKGYANSRRILDCSIALSGMAFP